ncbi:polysaccharide biosynthesis/export family protein [Negadavirga shengliensis]|uniref:Polysaccharide biosynthesis/export family protein n=1 Tax=Negadavirga shengliensis TaxID=1389218 RepID=A0ABV9SZB1_9BACT
MQDQGEERPLFEIGELVPSQTEDYFLQYNDVVDIQIRTTSPELNEIFLPPTAPGQRMNMGMGMQNGGDIFFMNGYTIDQHGNVELPLLGEVNLMGLTTREAKEKIEQKLTSYVYQDDFFVRVRLGGVRFSALGEFRQNGNFTILQNQITIFQAIAHAGDMTEIAKRDEVVLIRQYPEGSRTYRVNLNDKRIVGSEFYFIRPNDMLYAEPMRIRELGSGINFVQTFQLAITTLSAVLLVLNAIQ